LIFVLFLLFCLSSSCVLCFIFLRAVSCVLFVFVLCLVFCFSLSCVLEACHTGLRQTKHKTQDKEKQNTRHRTKTNKTQDTGRRKTKHKTQDEDKQNTRHVLCFVCLSPVSCAFFFFVLCLLFCLSSCCVLCFVCLRPVSCVLFV
jgi:Flp pilus assembly protein TadB